VDDLGIANRATPISWLIKPRTKSDIYINRYGRLRGTEDTFAVPHIGYAAIRNLGRLRRLLDDCPTMIWRTDGVQTWLVLKLKLP
jgi:hypothetical protein